MMGDPMVGDDGEEHQIRAWVNANEERVYHPNVEEGELEFSGLTKDIRTVNRRMYFCVCDSERHFRKDETALEHLREVGALD